jgi:hypothetical protein
MTSRGGSPEMPKPFAGTIFPTADGLAGIGLLATS